MSELNDPRVLFAAERTLLAWNRTSSGLIALGFLIDRASLMTQSARHGFAVAVGVAFLLLGVLLNVLSVVQYRRGIAQLQPAEIPPRYWVDLPAAASLAVAVLGAALALYLLWDG